jgi:hypothetical protein
VAGALAGALALLLWIVVARRTLAPIPLPADQPAERLAFAARWLAAPGCTLLIGIWVAARRGFLPDAIDGTRTPASHSLEINLRYNQNTLEQVVLAAIAWAGLALDLPSARLWLIPAMACAFLVGRATFWIGYLIYPMARAFGMVVTMAPTICAYGFLGWKALFG